jgi:hypothetical protein
MLIPTMIIPLIISLLCMVLAARTQSVVFEELLTAYLVAGKLQGDDMDGNANPQTNTPSWAHGVEIVIPGFSSNGDALGQVGGIAIISGPGFPDGPHEIVLGAHGGENVDLANSGMSPPPLIDMGLRVKPGGAYKVEFMAEGDADAEEACSIELVFQDEEVRQPKHWETSTKVTSTVDVDARGRDTTQTAASINPGDSTEIGGVIGAGAGDFAALGCNHIICRLTKGVVDEQQILLACVGGELIIGSGLTLPVTQRAFVSYLVKKNTSIYVAFRTIIEAGVMLGMISIGFVV